MKVFEEDFQEEKIMAGSEDPNYVREYDTQWALLGRVLAYGIANSSTWDEDNKTRFTDVGVVMDSLLQSEWLKNERRIAYTSGMQDAEKMIGLMQDVFPDENEEGHDNDGT